MELTVAAEKLYYEKRICSYLRISFMKYILQKNVETLGKCMILSDEIRVRET